MSALFKLAPPGGGRGFKVPGVEGRVEGWRKAITVGGCWGGGEDGGRPPLAPSRFAAQLARRRFTNNADLKVVCNLVRAASTPPTPHAPLPPPSRSPPQYDQTLRDGFGARERLAYGDCGWGDAEAEELGVALREVAAPEVVELDLSLNKQLRSLAAVGAAVGAGALASLQTLDLRECRALTSLPAVLVRLTSLRTLKLTGCDALTGMPDLSGLPQLQARRTMGCL